MTGKGGRGLGAGGTEEVALAREAVDDGERERRRDRDLLQALFDEERVYRTVIEGPERRVTMVNRLVREAAGSLLGRTARDIYPTDNPILAALERAFATGTAEAVHRLPAYLPGGNHGERYFTRSLVPLRDDQGNVDRVLHSVYDVTEEVRARHAHDENERRSQAELHRLMALLEEAPIIITVFEGVELRITMRNRRSRDLFPNDSQHMMGVLLGDVVPPDNPILASARRVFATGESLAIEATLHGITGLAGRSFASTLVPIRDPDGQITHVMVAGHETTEERRAREVLEAQARDLEVARSQAVEASLAKDEFLAMLGHELRNPLAPMNMTLELMRRRGDNSREVELLSRQVRHLTRLADDLLDISRITRGRVELQCRDLDLAVVVNRALEMTTPLIEQRHHRILTDLAPATVHGDADRLAQAVANLIINAAKYSETGSQIRIESRRRGDDAEVTVADDGVGIAPDMLDRIFEAFVQQPQILSRSQGGLGLGLAIVKSLVEAHGGAVCARSDGLGKGSTFTIVLPALEGPRARISIPPEVTLDPAPAPLRVLVVDDNYDAADALQLALEQLANVVAIAHDGSSALETAATFQPQIALLDLGLPGMDGFELARALRSLDRRLHLVAVTGYGQERDRERSREAGFDAHLVKPVGLDELMRLLRKVAAVTATRTAPY
jgi:signal transduction histidine kinase/ActR/RegA family two-component response regulator